MKVETMLDLAGNPGLIITAESISDAIWLAKFGAGEIYCSSTTFMGAIAEECPQVVILERASAPAHNSTKG